MATTNYEVMKRYMGGKEKFYPDPNDTTNYIELEPIYADKAAEIFFLMSRFEGATEKTLGQAMTKEVADVVNELLSYSVRKAVPDASEEEVKSFVNRYYFQLFQKIMEMNVPAKAK